MLKKTATNVSPLCVRALIVVLLLHVLHGLWGCRKKHYMLFTFSHCFLAKTIFFYFMKRGIKMPTKIKWTTQRRFRVYITVHIGWLCCENWTFINDFMVLSQNLNPVELFLMKLFSRKRFYSPVSIIVPSHAFMLNLLNSKCTIPQRLRSKKGFNVQQKVGQQQQVKTGQIYGKNSLKTLKIRHNYEDKGWDKTGGR